MKVPSNGYLANSTDGERKSINPELWHACAGPLVSLPPVGSLVVYFPQGHSEQVAASMQKQTDFIPSYPNLPSKLICMLHNVTLHADPETDEVYAQMTLQPVSTYDREAILTSEMGLKQSRQPAEFFCKTLTASDTSTHGGFSVPRRAAEKIFPPLDYSMLPPAQELSARDLHDNNWTFRHIYRGQPKRHLLTTGWSIFVSTKRLLTGDSVLFIRDEKSQLLVGVKRANRQQPALSSSVISSDSMHIGVLAAAAHAAANSSPFTVFYNPRASPCEFVIPFAKYNKAMFTQVSLGMRFRMMFETEESGVRRYMGTVTGISDIDPVRWKNSQWRNLQVGWDESTAGERPSRVSIWEIEPVVTPFYICPPPFFRPKLPRQPDDESDMENIFKRTMPWLGDEFGMKDTQNSIFPGLSLVQWMSMKQNNQFPGAQLGFNPSMLPSNALHNNLAGDDPSKLLSFQAPGLSATNFQFGKANPQNQSNQLLPTSLPWTQQQQLQQLLQTNINQQQQPYNQPQSRQQQPQAQEQKQLQQPQTQQQQNLNQQQLQQPQAQHPQFQQVRQESSHLQKQQQQQILRSPPTSNSLVGLNPIQSQNLQQPHQKSPVVNNSQSHSVTSVAKSSYPSTSLPQDSHFQQPMEQQPSILQRHQQQTQLQQSPPQLLQQNLAQTSNLQPQQQTQMQNLSHPTLSEQQLQLQMLQKLQQQQQQPLLSPTNSQLQQQQTYQQNHQMQQLPQLHVQMLPNNSNSFSTSSLMQSQTFPVNQPQGLHKLQTAVKGHSNLTDGEAVSCSTSPSTNNCQVSSNLLSKNQQPPSLLMGDSSVEPASNLLQDLPSKSDTRVRNEFHSSRISEQLKYKGSIADPLEASSSVTTYCHDAGNIQQNFHLSTLGLDGNVQSLPQSNIPFGANIDSLAPDTLLSRGYDSQKDLQNLLSNYGGTPRDLDTELSSAAMSSQAFGLPDISFNGGCSNDVPMNDTGVLNGGIWGSQTQRMRTYAKVQKRGSVGRSIDVARYKGYDELRHDLARMFGMEGQLEDPQSSDWKLVYVDHENDILLVGDDPWEEFVTCVQSIKILSLAEVQQMSLDGDLGNIPIPNQACSGTDSGNAWR